MGAGQAPSVTQGLRDLQGLRFTVVGAAGFVGTRVCATLQARGAQVWVPARNEPWPWEVPLGHVIYCAGLTADYLARPFDTVPVSYTHLRAHETDS